MMDLIAADRRSLADMLIGLSPAQWRAPSLCAGWTVAHVAAHLTMPFRISAEEFSAGLRQAGGQFTQFSDAIADRDSRSAAGRPGRDPAAQRGQPMEPARRRPCGCAQPRRDPRPGHHLAAGHRLPGRLPAMITVLDTVVSPGDRTLFGFPLDGLELRASDLDWSFGCGAAVHGRGREVLAVCSPDGRSPARCSAGRVRSDCVAGACDGHGGPRRPQPHLRRAGGPDEAYHPGPAGSRRGPAGRAVFADPAGGLQAHQGAGERAGLITRTQVAQSRPCLLQPARFDTAAAWIGRQRKTWEDRYDRLDEHLAAPAAGRGKPQSRGEKRDDRARGVHLPAGPPGEPGAAV